MFWSTIVLVQFCAERSSWGCSWSARSPRAVRCLLTRHTTAARIACLEELIAGVFALAHTMARAATWAIGSGRLWAPAAGAAMLSAARYRAAMRRGRGVGTHHGSGALEGTDSVSPSAPTDVHRAPGPAGRSA